jgi:hypothetical protein
MTLSRYYDAGPGNYARQLQVSSSGTDNAYLKVTSAGTYASLFFEVGGQSQARLQTLVDSMSLSSRGDSTFISNYAGAGTTDNFLFGSSGATYMTLSRYYDAGPGNYARQLQVSSSGADNAYLKVTSAGIYSSLFFEVGGQSQARLQTLVNSMSLSSRGDSTFISNYAGAGTTGNFVFVNNSAGGINTVGIEGSARSVLSLKISGLHKGQLYYNDSANSLFLTSTGDATFNMVNLNILNRVQLSNLATGSTAVGGDGTVMVDSLGNLHVLR